jgi:K+-transporting ATPase ATPase A chain
VVRALRHDCAGIGNCRFAGGQKRLEVNAGTMPTHGLMFIALLAGTVVLISVLNYVPALALGPVAEHLQLVAPR